LQYFATPLLAVETTRLFGGGSRIEKVDPERRQSAVYVEKPGGW
jgi:hypothetical protein